MRCAVVGEGREVLHECDLWSEAVEWLTRYMERDSGGWAWFALTKDGVTRARYVVRREEEAWEECGE